MYSDLGKFEHNINNNNNKEDPGKLASCGLYLHTVT